jgi:nucleoside-diphosphate-sugar epimerase
LARQFIAAGFEVHGLTRQDIARVGPSAAEVHFHRIDGRTETITTFFKKVMSDMALHLARLTCRENLTSDLIPFVETYGLLGTAIAQGCEIRQIERLHGTSVVPPLVFLSATFTAKPIAVRRT